MVKSFKHQQLCSNLDFFIQLFQKKYLDIFKCLLKKWKHLLKNCPPTSENSSAGFSARASSSSRYACGERLKPGMGSKP
jgi:hypothetical protein